MNRGEQIRKRRTELGWSQAELARRLSKTRSLLSYIEKTGKVADLTYYQILRVLGITSEAEGHIDQNRLSLLSDAEAHYVPRISELDHLRKENSSLKEIIELQKSIISMMQKKSEKQ